MENRIIIIATVLFFLLIGVGLFFYFHSKKETFQSKKEMTSDDDYRHLKFANRNNKNDGIEQTSVVSIDAIKTRRYPFVMENTTNHYNSDSPMLCSGNRVGTNLGKSP